MNGKWLTKFFQAPGNQPSLADYRIIQIFETIRNIVSYKRLDANLGDYLL